MKKTCSFIAVAALCLTSIASRNAVAQDTASQDAAAGHQQIPPVLEIIVENIKEGHGVAHMRVESDWAGVARRHKMANSLALVSMTGPSTAWFLVAHVSFAGIGEEEKVFDNPIVRAEVNALEARDGEHRVSSRSMYAIFRKDLSYHAEDFSVGKTRYSGITIFHMKLGHDSDFEEGSKKFIAADEKAGLKDPWLVYQVVGGAPDDEYILFSPMESLKSVDDGAMNQKATREAMGADEYDRLMKGSGDVFTAINFNLYSVNPRMSNIAKEDEDLDPAFWRPKPPVVKPVAPSESAKPPSGQ